MTRFELKALRTAVADYMYSEGCRCCQNIDAHEQHKATLGKMLKVRKYPDGSGYDFYRYRTPDKPREPQS